MNVPMLDEQEYTAAAALYRKCMRGIQDFRKQHSVPLEGVDIDLLFQPLRQWYAQFTGYQDMNQNTIMHHRIALYGPPCGRCGVILRTPKATMCFECGALRD